MAINFDRQNQRVEDWAQRTENSLKGTAGALGIIHRTTSPSNGSSVDKIKHRFRLRAGVIEVISFRFPRSLIWPHKGAGRGMGGLLGSTWYDRLGIKRTTNPESLGKMGIGSRPEKPWLNQAMESPQGVDELATIVAEESGDAIVNNLLIK